MIGKKSECNNIRKNKRQIEETITKRSRKVEIRNGDKGRGKRRRNCENIQERRWRIRMTEEKCKRKYNMEYRQGRKKGKSGNVGKGRRVEGSKDVKHEA